MENNFIQMAASAGHAIDLQKMPILPKKSSFRMKLILILAGM
jgi:hypothetical protein